MTLLVALLLVAQDPVQEMAAKSYDGPGGKLLYRLYTPKAASSENRLPLVLFPMAPASGGTTTPRSSRTA
jgi:predicted peptidase